MILSADLLNHQRGEQVFENGLTVDKKRQPSFAGAADLIEHAVVASKYLKEMSTACANGDKAAARAALRRAISELETARAMLRTGIE
jgi:hypothetical protein